MTVNLSGRFWIRFFQIGSESQQPGPETLFGLPAGGGVERGGEYHQPQAQEGAVEPGHQTGIKMPL